ncbi:schlafen-like protein 1 [Saccostrea echinata]|uniref:schlafen-like protein 1 n=1 Tax=Saccostrea echinata TaxID=191078 RepID=UPI002A8014D9|nr:schlafen-like protein 1 [Saccostrea echinata]XP_061178515.1 schlafen-like protein 1 [Saccostrea echinata]
MALINYRVVYLGNLRSDTGLKNLKDNILNLFRHYLGIGITLDDIFIHTNHGKGSWYAFVNCHEEHQAEFVLDQLETWESRRHTRFNFTSICEGSQPLLIDYKRETKHKNKKSRRKKRKPKGNDSPDITEQFDEYYPEDLTREKPLQENDYTSLPSLKSGKNFLGLTKKIDQPALGIYLDGEQLGNETRNKEFKKGGGEYVKNVMKKHVSKYVCAFLNSGEEGTLYLGVNDNGCVEGIPCQQAREDGVRLDIDEAIKTIIPPVFPNIYEVKFTPVFYKLGVPKEDYKVIEIIVHGTGDIDRLYHSPHGVFLRRDGGVQSLTVPEIQEWSIQKHQKEIRRLEERLQKQEDLFERRTQEEKDKKSRVCVVM